MYTDLWLPDLGDKKVDKMDEVSQKAHTFRYKTKVKGL